MGGSMKKIWLIMIVVIILSGCTATREKEERSLGSIMKNIITHELNEVEPEHKDEVNEWLADARLNGTEGQFYIKAYSDETSEFKYSYIYGKGYSDYEVSFSYTSSDLTSKGDIRIAGIKGENYADSFVKIKSINDRSIMFIVSDENSQNNK
jgi:hypothetical protein